jgi:hypothetical protein
MFPPLAVICVYILLLGSISYKNSRIIIKENAKSLAFGKWNSIVCVCVCVCVCVLSQAFERQTFDVGKCWK